MSALSTADLTEQNEKAQYQATRLANLAVRALIEEAELTPKPALVDQRGPGAHTDLSLMLMRCSAHYLRPSFELMPWPHFGRFPARHCERTWVRSAAGLNNRCCWPRAEPIRIAGRFGLLAFLSPLLRWERTLRMQWHTGLANSLVCPMGVPQSSKAMVRE
jgi:ATP:dephospho-CoA triphosphoribosyl transferase